MSAEIASEAGSPASEGSGDDRLVARAAAGDREAFQELFRKYHRLVRMGVWNFFRRADPAEDLCQEVFLKAFLHLGKLRQGTSFKAWLMRITYGTCVDTARKRRVREAAFTDAENNIAADETMEPACGTEEGREVFQALTALSPLDGLIVWLHYVEGFAFQEIEEIAEISANTLRQKAFRAIRRLRKELG